MNQYEKHPDAPNAIQVELTEGCNLYCDFCGLRGIRAKETKNWKFMRPQTAYDLAVQISNSGWNPRIEFAMHGEPTLHPAAATIIDIFRGLLPHQYMMMTTNGGGLLPRSVEKCRALLNAGLNTIAIDDYQSVKLASKIRTALSGSDIEVLDYPADRNASPHTRHRGRRVVFVEDISVAAEGTHSALNNHCGAAAPPLEQPLEQRCAKPFRELSVRYNGNVALCCNDWRGVYKCGNVTREGLVNVWGGPAMRSARRYLYHKQRGGLKPCDGCDARSYRVGLLPDKYGKEALPQPTKRDQAVVNATTAGRSYAVKVKRPWER